MEDGNARMKAKPGDVGSGVETARYRISNRVLWTVVALCFITMMATSVLLATKLAGSAYGYANTIDLLTSNATNSELASSATEAVSAENPSFQVIDADGVWTSKTDINIFDSVYFNEVGEATVRSDDGEHIIAPGTSASYNWSLYNKGDCPLTYTMDLSCMFFGLPQDTSTLPIEFRLAHDGEWVFGDETLWVSGDYLHSAVLKGSIDASRYDNYRLDWRWAYSTTQDELDTLFGNAAASGFSPECLIQINVKTQADTNPTGSGGAITGDQIRKVVFALALIIVAACAVAIGARAMAKRKEAKR